jgi:hypothetical protein
VTALDPAAVILDDAETAQTPTIVEVRPQNEIARTANEARVSQTTPEKVLPQVLPHLVLARQPRQESHGRTLERSKKHISVDLIEVVAEGGADLMRITEVLDALEMLVDMPILEETHMVIQDMPTRARATSVQGAVEAVVLLDRKMDREINASQKGSRMLRTRIAVWGPRQVMRSASRR